MSWASIAANLACAARCDNAIRKFCEALKVMDPITAATAFGSIISLMVDFRSQRAGDQKATQEEFEAWLRETRHEEIVTLLNQNAATAAAIKGLLNQDRATLQTQLEKLDKSLAAIASAMDGFRDLAHAVRPEAKIPEQAVEFLRQFDASVDNRVLQVTYWDGPMATGKIMYTTVNNSKKLTYSDIRFIEDDLLTLVKLDLLRLEHNGKDQPIFCLTRAASEFVRGLPPRV